MTRKVEVETVDLINISDELSRARAYLECVYLASEGIAADETANAIQSVMIVAQDKLKEVSASIDKLYSEPDGETAEAA